MIRRILALTAPLLWALPAWAGQTTLQGKDATSATQYFGEVTGTIGSQATWFPMLVGCDATMPTQCWSINSSGQLAIQAPPSLPALTAGSATIGKVDILGNAGGTLDTAGGTSASTAIGIQGITSGVPVAVSGTFWQATQPISAASLPLPSGAATAANQTSVESSLGSSASSAVTVQGGSSGVPLPVSGTFWQSTQPISAASLPLPSGAATAANQTAVTSAPGTAQTTAVTVQGNASGIALPVTANAGSGTFTVGQATGTNLHVVCDSGCSSSSSPSFGAAFSSTGTPVGGEYFTTTPTYTNNAFMEPFTINSHGAMTVDGSAVTQPISAASLPLPSGAATSANQTNVQVAASTQAAATNPSTVVQLNPNQPNLTTPLNENITQVGGTSVVLDACSAASHVQVAIDITASGTTRIITGTSGKYTHICSMNFPNQPVAVSFNILEGTGTTCGTGTFAPFGGGTTAMTGYALAVNGGFINNGGGSEVGYASHASGDDVCIITNAALNGYILYVQL